jgi:tripartite-type tricarboxylate transporter receptor subunit TctC
LVARKDLPSNSLKELVAYAKANPRKLTYASGGNGSGQHVLAAALWQLAGVELVHVPYRGAQAAYQDLLGGRVDLFFDLSPTARGQIDGGTLKALAVSGSATGWLFTRTCRPSPKPAWLQLELESWFGLFAPAKVPAEALDRLRARNRTHRPGARCGGDFPQSRRQAAEFEHRPRPGRWCKP